MKERDNNVLREKMKAAIIFSFIFLSVFIITKKPCSAMSQEEAYKIWNRKLYMDRIPADEYKRLLSDILFNIDMMDIAISTEYMWIESRKCQDDYWYSCKTENRNGHLCLIIEESFTRSDIKKGVVSDRNNKYIIPISRIVGCKISQKASTRGLYHVTLFTYEDLIVRINKRGQVSYKNSANILKFEPKKLMYAERLKKQIDRFTQAFPSKN